MMMEDWASFNIDATFNNVRDTRVPGFVQTAADNMPADQAHEQQRSMRQLLGQWFVLWLPESNQRRKRKSPEQVGAFLSSVLEAEAGIEPAYTALQAAA